MKPEARTSLPRPSRVVARILYVPAMGGTNSNVAVPSAPVVTEPDAPSTGMSSTSHVHTARPYSSSSCTLDQRRSTTS